VNLDLFSSEVGEKACGADRRSGFAGGGGWRRFFRGIPGMTRLMGYWYHYAIMFEGVVYFDDD